MQICSKDNANQTRQMVRESALLQQRPAQVTDRNPQLQRGLVWEGMSSGWTLRVSPKHKSLPDVSAAHFLETVTAPHAIGFGDSRVCTHARG